MRWFTPLLPSALSFGPLLVVIAVTSESHAIRLGGYGAALILSLGLVGLFSLIAHQERRLTALETRMDAERPNDG